MNDRSGGPTSKTPEGGAVSPRRRKPPLSLEGDGLWAFMPILVAILVLAISAAMVWNAATSFGSESRRIPLVIGIPMTILAVINLAREARKALGKRFEPDPEETSSRDWLARLDSDVGVDAESFEGLEDVREGAISLPRAIGVLGLATVMFLVLGQVLFAPIFIIWQMRFVTKQGWTKTLITGALAFALMYGLIAGLEMPSYDGWLAEQWPWLMAVIHP